MSDYHVLQRMERAGDVLHEEINKSQITHPIDEYTEERVATLLAKVAEARRFWPVQEYLVNV